MKKIGIIMEYDGYCGRIRSLDNIDYLLLKSEIIDVNDKIMIGDYVTFDEEIIKHVEIPDSYVARIIRKIDKEEIREVKN